MSKPKVLIVDDEVEVLDYLKIYIPLCGYEVETATNGIEALAKFNVFKPHLILLDLFMPGMDGVKFLKEIRVHNETVKILILTGTNAAIKDLKAMGADQVLYKPIDLTVLSEEIKTFLPLVDDESGEDYARILIADDEPDICEYLKEIIFEPMGFEVFIAHDVSSALEIYRSKRPQIVLVDLAMPNRESGQNLVHQLAILKDPPPQLSLIVITAALGEDPAQIRNFEREGHPVFTKPIDIARLKERVLEACRKHNLRLKTGSDK